MLQWNKALSRISTVYQDYASIFFPNYAIKLFENIGLNEYAIELVERNKPFYGFSYALSPIEWEILKTYIKTHLKTGFIQSSKSTTDTSIFYDKKPNRNLKLCMDYQDLNNLIIQNLI